ncbi:hypothetical protein ABPG72_014588 [Tetrahymena utriculariae]
MIGRTDMSMKTKQTIYSEVIKESLEIINEDSTRQVDILKLINEKLGYQTMQIQYDAEFSTSLIQYFQKMHHDDTKNKEDVLYKLLEQCLNKNLILNRQQSDNISKQIIILKRLRRIQQNLKKEPKKALDYLRDEYDQEGCLGEEELLQSFEQDKIDLKMKIENEVKDLTKDKIKSLLLNQNNQEKVIKNVEDLEQILLDEYNSQKIEESMQQRLLQEVNFIRNIISMMKLKDLFGLEYVTVQPYGSIVSGFAQKSSDIDVSINTNCYLDENLFIKLLDNFIKQYCQKKQIKNIKTEPIPQVQTPLLKYTRIYVVEQKEIKIEIDICINNILGCTNSLMLHTLSQLHPRIQQLGIIIKHWAKQRGVSSKTHLSSYSFILMMFCFLFREKILNSEFVMKRKEKVCYVDIKRKRFDEDQTFQTNLYFYSNTDQLKENYNKWLKTNNKPSLDEVPLSQLFIEFIKYYHSSSSVSDKRFISIFNFNVSYSQREYKYDNYDDKFYFNIEDPFDIKHNPGQKTRNQQDLYQNAFEEAFNQIKNKQYNLLFTSKQKK